MTFQGILVALIFGFSVLYLFKKVFSGMIHSKKDTGCDKCEVPDAVLSKKIPK